MAASCGMGDAMFEHLPPLPSAQVPGLTNLQDGYLGHAPLVSLGPGRSRYLVPEGPIDVNYEPIRQRPLLAGRAVAVLKQGAHSFEGFSVVEPRGDTSASGPFVPVEGLFTLNDLMSSGTCGMAGAFAFLCGASDGQTLVVSKRSEDGTWTVAYRDVVAGRSLCLSITTVPVPLELRRERG